MYYYIYDIFTSDKKYERVLQKIEARLIELDVAGGAKKMNVLKNLEEVINEAKNNQIKNIIAVGNDDTLGKVANLAVGKNLTVGIIPIEEPNAIGSALGINSWEEGCRAVARRKIIEIDAGRINQQFFLFSVESPTNAVSFDFDNYSIKPLKNNQLTGLYNLNITKESFYASPNDGVMEAVFWPGQPGWWHKFLRKKSTAVGQKSIFPIKKLVIRHLKKPVSLTVDRQRIIKTPAEIEVTKKKLAIIVGRGESF